MWGLDQDKSSLPPLVDKALKLLNLKQVAFEIENSVMSKVSCTACRAGEVWFKKKMNGIIKIVRLRCWIVAALHQNWKIGKGNQKNDLSVLRQFENSIPPSV